MSIMKLLFEKKMKKLGILSFGTKLTQLPDKKKKMIATQVDFANVYIKKVIWYEVNFGTSVLFVTKLVFWYLRINLVIRPKLTTRLIF